MARGVLWLCLLCFDSVGMPAAPPVAALSRTAVGCLERVRAEASGLLGSVCGSRVGGTHPPLALGPHGAGFFWFTVITLAQQAAQDVLFSIYEMRLLHLFSPMFCGSWGCSLHRSLDADERGARAACPPATLETFRHRVGRVGETQDYTAKQRRPREAVTFLVRLMSHSFWRRGVARAREGKGRERKGASLRVMPVFIALYQIYRAIGCSR